MGISPAWGDIMCEVRKIMPPLRGLGCGGRTTVSCARTSLVYGYAYPRPHAKL